MRNFTIIPSIARNCTAKLAIPLSNLSWIHILGRVDVSRLNDVDTGKLLLATQGMTYGYWLKWRAALMNRRYRPFM